jgi:acyl CoA:acetate/3-ketoacid CoA transferase beta subunit
LARGAGARSVNTATTHLTWDGRPKLVDRCSYPLTSDRPADLIVTERATFAVADGRLVLVETASGTTPQWLARHTAAPFTTPADPPPAGPDPGPGAPSAPARSPAPARGEL